MGRHPSGLTPHWWGPSVSEEDRQHLKEMTAAREQQETARARRAPAVSSPPRPAKKITNSKPKKSVNKVSNLSKPPSRSPEPDRQTLEHSWGHLLPEVLDRAGDDVRRGFRRALGEIAEEQRQRKTPSTAGKISSSKISSGRNPARFGRRQRGGRMTL